MFPEPSDLIGTRKGASHFSNMRSYYFHVRDLEPSIDIDGVELADNEAAWHEGVLFAGEVLRNAGGPFRPGQECTVEVANESGKVVHTIRITPK
jgi:hypothetical protein